jgi:hypothetical protein
MVKESSTCPEEKNAGESVAEKRDMDGDSLAENYSGETPGVPPCRRFKPRALPA